MGGKDDVWGASFDFATRTLEAFASGLRAFVAFDATGAADFFVGFCITSSEPSEASDSSPSESAASVLGRVSGEVVKSMAWSSSSDIALVDDDFAKNALIVDFGLDDSALAFAMVKVNVNVSRLEVNGVYPCLTGKRLKYSPKSPPDPVHTTRGWQDPLLGMLSIGEITRSEASSSIVRDLVCWKRRRIMSNEPGTTTLSKIAYTVYKRKRQPGIKMNSTFPW